MDKTRNKETGSFGEDEACRYLESIGYKILERNLRLFCGEIDILAQDKKTIVLVEVKTVTGSGFGSAAELVRYQKQVKLRTLAKSLEQEYPKRTIRIDVVGVYGDKIDHIVNAVQ